MHFTPASPSCGRYLAESLFGCPLRFLEYEQIGEGGMGVCYKSVDASGAAKVVKFSKVPADSAISDEFDLLEKLRHPNVLTVYRFFAAGDLRGYEMDTMVNGNLHEKIVRRGARPGRFTHRELASCFHDILSGLAYIHAHQILHRDIKPANILFDHGMRAVLGDLGLGVKLVTDPIFTPCAMGRYTFCGTPGFVAPEVVAGDLYGKPADIWSFNRVVHACLMGDPSGDTLCDTHRDLYLLQAFWVYALIRRSGCLIPCERAPAEELRNLIEGSGCAGASSAPSDVKGVSQDIRADGKAALLHEGRVAERRIRKKRCADEIDLGDDKLNRKARNVQRKVRRRAALCQA